MTPAELAELDLAVAKVEGVTVVFENGMVLEVIKYDPPDPIVGEGDYRTFQPTVDRYRAMRLLEKYRLNLTTAIYPGGLAEGADRKLYHAGYVASCDKPNEEIFGTGETPAIAICRAVIALKEPT